MRFSSSTWLRTHTYVHRIMHAIHDGNIAYRPARARAVVMPHGNRIPQ